MIIRLILELNLPIIAFIKLYFGNKKNIDGVICYSPSIFWAPAIYCICRQHSCKSYLILRDIFPDWAYDIGIITNKYTYAILRIFAKAQYLVADKVGVQSPSNITYIKQRYNVSNKKLEVLENWIGSEGQSTGPKQIIEICKKNTVLVHAGNVGYAQNLSLIISVADLLKQSDNFIFLILGGGQEFELMQTLKNKLGAKNIIFYEYVNEKELQAILAVSDIGIVSLNLKHSSHNIPGKFLNYLKNSMGILACVNPKNDLVDLVDLEGIGLAYCDNDPVELAPKIQELLADNYLLAKMRKNARALYSKRYKSNVPAQRICDFFANREY